MHIACQYHESASVIRYLIELDTTPTLETVDKDGNTALHYACRNAKNDTIALLLEKLIPYVYRHVLPKVVAIRGSTIIEDSLASALQ